MSKTKQDIFSMTKHYTREHARDFACIGVSITTSTDVESLSFLVSNVINQFSLGLKLVGITSDGGTNLARCKDILESNFDNTRFFDLGEPMFVLGCISRVLDNACNSGVMDVQYDDVRVDTDFTMINMQRCITWTRKSQKGGKSLETAHKHVGLPCKRLIKPFKLVLSI